MTKTAANLSNLNQIENLGGIMKKRLVEIVSKHEVDVIFSLKLIGTFLGCKHCEEFVTKLTN